MENLFVWMLIFAAATIGLLGTFLIASERELKAKRREVEELTSKLGDNDADKAVNQPAQTPQAEPEATAELRARNEELLAEVASLSNHLEASQRNIEELRLAEQRQEANEAEKQQLQASHQRLQEETVSLRKEIAAYQARLNESATHESLKLETEVTKLKRKLEESENAKRELTESRQVAFRDQQQQLETQIENLQRQLAREQEKVRELESARGRLEEMERLDQDLRGENRRLQEENARWEKQVAVGNESQKRLGLLRQYVGELQAKQASVIESQVQLQDDTSALVRLLDGSQGDLPLGMPQPEVAKNPNLLET
jgi:chromosome segregation ATPase